MNKSECQLIGTLVKTHGYKGEYTLVSDHFLNDEIEDWESVLLEIEGLLVPFFINSIRINNDTSAIIGFEGTEKPETAKEYVGCKVFQELKRIETPEENHLAPNILIGYKVIDHIKGEIGVIDDVLDYNQNLLLQIMNGKQEILIPATDEIIVKVIHKKKELHIIAPEGLIELND